MWNKMNGALNSANAWMRAAENRNVALGLAGAAAIPALYMGGTTGAGMAAGGYFGATRGGALAGATFGQTSWGNRAMRSGGMIGKTSFSGRTATRVGGGLLGAVGGGIAGAALGALWN